MKFPKPIGFVNDFECILSVEEILEIENIISEYEKKTTKEIAVITTDSLYSYKKNS